MSRIETNEPQTGRNACKHIKSGAVLAIPVRDGHWVIGQVLHAETVLFLGISLTLFDCLPSPSQIDMENLELFSWTTDGEVYRGNWWVLGNAKAPPEFSFSNYRVCYAGQESVMSFFGEFIRPFDPQIDQSLRPHISRSPKLVESAIRTAFGIGDRYDDLEEMKTP